MVKHVRIEIDLRIRCVMWCVHSRDVGKQKNENAPKKRNSSNVHVHVPCTKNTNN